MEARFIKSLTSPKIPGFEWQEPDDDGDRNSFRNILTEGCTILQITPGQEKSNAGADFVYTIGFYLNLLHPELFIVGVSGESAAKMMNDLFAYVESGNRIEDGHTWTYDLGKGDRKMVARLVPQERYLDYLGYGCWFYRSLLWKVEPIAEHKFPVLQLFWPDPAGLYPWDPGCDPRAVEIQTLVAQPESPG